jgi:hypothetical protein
MPQFFEQQNPEGADERVIFDKLDSQWWHNQTNNWLLGNLLGCGGLLVT